MLTQMLRALGGAAVAAAALVVAGGAQAAFDGKSNLVCSAIDVVGCTDDAGCVQGRARTFDLPDFVVLDFEKKVVRATDESGHKEVSPIKNQEVTGTQLVLQGIENGHGWTLTVHRDNGRMSTVLVGEKLSLMLFGVCNSL